MKRMVALVALAASCTSVRMVQREGCWMKQTDTTFSGTREELGFCTRPQAEAAQDRLARLVQECMAQADYRWENRAIAAWTRGDPIPPQEADAELTRACMGQATQALGLEAENNELKTRLAELSQDRDALKAAADKEKDFLHESSDKMVTALGEAAKRPAPNATATATSTGTAKTDTKSDTPPAPAPGVTVMATPAPVIVPRARTPRPAASAPACKVAQKEPTL